jgi:hypothetical protein
MQTQPMLKKAVFENPNFSVTHCRVPTVPHAQSSGQQLYPDSTVALTELASRILHTKVHPEKKPQSKQIRRYLGKE